MDTRTAARYRFNTLLLALNVPVYLFVVCALVLGFLLSFLTGGRVLADSVRVGFQYSIGCCALIL